MWYNFDVQKFGWQLLPPLLRGAVMRALLKALLQPLVWILDRFKALRSEGKEQLLAGGLALSLVEAIRRAYNLHEGDVYIVDAEHKECTLYKGYEEQRPLYLQRAGSAAPPLYIYYKDAPRVEPDYYIHVPDFLEREADELRRIIEQNRPAGRKYMIIYYPYE